MVANVHAWYVVANVQWGKARIMVSGKQRDGEARILVFHSKAHSSLPNSSR